MKQQSEARVRKTQSAYDNFSLLIRCAGVGKSARVYRELFIIYKKSKKPRYSFYIFKLLALGVSARNFGSNVNLASNNRLNIVSISLAHVSRRYVLCAARGVQLGPEC